MKLKETTAYHVAKDDVIEHDNALRRVLRVRKVRFMERELLLVRIDTIGVGEITMITRSEISVLKKYEAEDIDS